VSIADRSRRYRERHPGRLRLREAERSARRSARSPEDIDADRARIHPSGRKRCPSCREALTFDAFYANRSRPDGLGALCRECFLADRADRAREAA
jgi:hypothetical protein